MQHRTKLKNEIPLPLKPLRLSFPKDVTMKDIFNALNVQTQKENRNFNILTTSQKKQRKSLLRQIDSFIEKRKFPKEIFFYIANLFDHFINKNGINLR